MKNLMLFESGKERRLTGGQRVGGGRLLNEQHMAEQEA